MTALALRGLMARKLRTALTAVAVLLGVAMVTGTYIETDQIRRAFEGITRESVKKLDVIVIPKQSFGSQMATEPQTMPAELVDTVGAVPGVAAAHGELSALGQILIDGEIVDTMGAPGIVFADSPARFDPSEIVAGRRPAAPHEATLLQQNAEDHDVVLGDRIGVATRHGAKTVEVVGVFAFGGDGAALGGATAVELMRPQVERWFDLRGRIGSISVIADAGVSPDQLSARIAGVLPAGTEAQTATENAQETADEINDQIGSFLTPVLLALAGAAVLVGAFIIFNTFSITVAQRMREFAMLRALGATRAQILAAVAGEALAIGVVASVAGLAAGIGISKLLNALFDAAGFGIPRSGLVLEPRTIAIALGVGIGVTLVSALVPAARAMRVAPVAAMAGVAPRPSARRRRFTAIATALLALAGAALTAQGLFGGGPATAKLGAIATGAVALFIAIALSARYVVRPLAAAIGWPIERTFHTAGRLARENAERNPGRTAVTSAALMIGLGLVVFVAVFAAGLKSSFSGQIDRLVSAEMIVYSQSFQPFPGRTRGRVEAIEGVQAAVPQLFEQVEVNGERSNLAVDVIIGADPATLGQVYAFDWIDGDDELLGDLGPNEILIEEQFAKSHGLATGDAFQVETPSGSTAQLTAIGVYRDPTILQGSIATTQTLRAISPVRDPVSMLIALDEGVDSAAIQAEIKRALERYPSLEVENKAEYRETLSGQLDRIVYLLYALLAMSVVISLFGIANSLFLSIHERTPELGVLRAIGATRDQLRRVIRYESVITSVIGGILGIAIGIVFAAIITQSLSEFGLSMSLPVVQLLIFLLIAVAVGVVGAIAPARRASRIDVLEAIHYE